MSLFLLKMTLSMLLFMGIYQLLLARTALHRLKRFFLLSSLVLPLIIPFVELESERPEVTAVALHETLTTSLWEEVPTPSSMPERENVTEPSPVPELTAEPQPQSAQHDVWFWLALLYGLVTLALFLRFGINIYHILKRAAKASVTCFQNRKVYLIEEPLVPHNFLHLIFISKKDYKNTDARDRLLTHEQSHARQLHSLDILLLELIRTVFWFNPLYIFWSRAIRANHEYLADAAVISRFQDVTAYKRLLLSFADHKGQPYRLISTSNYSLTKMRFIMMTKKISKTGMILRSALLAPMVILSLVAMTVKAPGTIISLPEADTPTGQLPATFEGAKPSIFPIDEKFKPEFRLHFDATMHRGTDREYNTEGVSYFAPLGTPVRATADGVVVTSKKNKKRGNYVVIRHGDEYETLYASLNESTVSAGQKVTKGTTIGTVGKSIENSNVHLHYEVIKNGKRIDPQEYYILKKTPEFIWSINRIHLETQGFSLIKELGLPKGSRSIQFPEDWKYTSLIHSKDQILLLKGNKVVKTLEKKDLSVEQIKALKGLKHDTRAIKSTPLTDKIIKNWQDPDKYLVIIDQKVMEAEALKAFDPNKVAFFWHAKLRKNDPEKPLYRIDAISEQGYKQLLKENNAQIIERAQENRNFLDILLKGED